MNQINQILNVSQKEWPRILISWSLVFLTRVGFIIGWTVLIASFLSQVGIQYLPLLFLVNALFVMTGTLVYRHYIHKVKREVLITSTTLCGATLLILAATLMQFENHWYFALFLLAQGVFIGQLSILISLFNENLFSPLESQRVLPLIESGETIGGIIAGLLLNFLSHSFPPYKFILLGVLLLLLILPIVLKYNASTLEIPKLEPEHIHKTRPLKEQFKELRKIPFVKGLMVVVLLHWGMMNIVEYQSMKAVQQDVYNQEEETLVLETGEQSVQLAEVGTIEEENLTQKLGVLHIIFYSTALLMQLIFASRILSGLGVIPTMMLHPILTLLNVTGMSLRFNMVTASLTRGSYELTTVLFNNAAESSYYAIEHGVEEETKEFVLGIMRPLGAILGTLSMMGITFWLSNLQETLALNALILLGAVVMLFTMRNLGKKYSEMCEQNLSHKKDLPTRINAIEILGQRGHEKNFPALQKLLKREQEPVVLKETILRTLGLREDLEAISTILELLEDKEERLRHAAVLSLKEYHDLKQHLMKQAFTRHRIIESLKHVLEEENSDIVRDEAVQCFYQIAPEELTSFLIESIEKETPHKATFIQMLKLFPDPNLAYYLSPYLEDKDPKIKGAALIALWQFKNMQGTLSHHLEQILHSPKEAVLLQAIAVAGKLHYSAALPVLKNLRSNGSPELQAAATLALAQLEDSGVVPDLIDQFSDPLHEWFEHSGVLLAELPKKFQEQVRYLLHMRFIEKIHKLLTDHKNIPLHEWEKERLQTLKSLYAKLSAHKEVHTLQNLLDSSDSSYL